uniref:Uncharacterized protein n=1 Tax=Romanomermis culicivorax TaxID=13658 RepID=A0A915JH91_ROMCU
MHVMDCKHHGMGARIEEICQVTTEEEGNGEEIKAEKAMQDILLKDWTPGKNREPKIDKRRPYNPDDEDYFYYCVPMTSSLYFCNAKLVGHKEWSIVIL